MHRGSHAYIQCACGRESTLYLPDLPASKLDASGHTINPEALAKMRCRRCGRVGRPAEVRFFWASGMPEGDVDVRDAGGGCIGIDFKRLFLTKILRVIYPI